MEVRGGGGRLINFLPLKRGGFLERGAYLRGGLTRGFTVDPILGTLDFTGSEHWAPLYFS